MPTTPIRAADSHVVAAPIDRVWAVLADVARYPEWWPPSVRPRVVVRGAPLVGADLEISPRGGRPFRCEVVAVHPPTRMDLRYHGAVDGTGGWELAEVTGDGAPATRVTYTIDVVAHGWLVAVLARVIHLAERHSAPMREVLAALGHRVGDPPAGANRA